MTNLKKITSYRLFLPILCLILVLFINVIKTPTFFDVSIKNGVLYGYIIDVINRASELVILAVGMTLVVASSGGTDISVGAVMSVSAAICCFILSAGQQTTDILSESLSVGSNSCNRSRYHLWLLEWIFGRKDEDSANGCDFNTIYCRKRNCPINYKGSDYLYQSRKLQIAKEEYLPGIPLPTTIFVAIIVVILANLILKKTALGLYIQSVGINAKASRVVGLKQH